MNEKVWPFIFTDFEVNTDFCAPLDVFTEHHGRADCSVGPGALRRHQQCRLGNQGSEAQREHGNPGRFCKDQLNFFSFTLLLVGTCEYF